jgi:hypothetical protein
MGVATKPAGRTTLRRHCKTGGLVATNPLKLKGKPEGDLGRQVYIYIK